MRRAVAHLATAAALAAVAAAAPATRAAPPLTSGRLERASVSSSGGQGTAQYGYADHPALSGNGRLLTFTSNDSGLTADCGLTARYGGLGYNVYARDLATGRTELVSADTHGCPTLEGSDAPVTSSVSRDGRFVAFTSCGQLVPGFKPAGNTLAVYVRDRLRHRTIPVSVGYNGKPNNAYAQYPAISGNGRYVVFQSGASNLVPHDPLGHGDNLVQDVYVRDLTTGRTERVGSAHPRAHRFEKVNASISDDGRWITFQTADAAIFDTTDYGPEWAFHRQFLNGEGFTQVFLYDRITKRTRMISRSAEGWAADNETTFSDFDRGGNRTLSGDGRYIVFQSKANNLVPGDPTAAGRELQPDLTPDIYLYDRIAGTLRRVTTGLGGLPADQFSANPAISANGRWITYESAATNLGPIDLTPAVTNDSGRDVYLTDRTTGAHQLLSLSNDGVQATLNAIEPTVSDDGSVVAFSSAAPNLVPDDTNGIPDTFAWHRAA
ncbi:MAG TPA: hypothetical protein VFQ85_08210 [Mycobacteriales bacterium]|jgi:Tol biopolymer transport system component|nr:hypothetical protein [Mycobacteriales bacterium]